MSSQGEIQLREKILNSLLAIGAIGDPEQLQDYVEAAISAIKEDNYFVNWGGILQVYWDNIGFVDGIDEPFYSIKVENYEGDEDGEYDI